MFSIVAPPSEIFINILLKNEPVKHIFDVTSEKIDTLLSKNVDFGAGDGNRTRVFSLGS